MNEGFASFFEYMCMDGVQRNTFSHISTTAATEGPWPRSEYGTVDLYTAAATPDGEGVGVHEGPHQHALRTDGGVAAKPLFHVGQSAGGDTQYSKGSAVLTMIYDYMERVLPGSFLRGINTYLTEHAFATVVTSDIWRALGNACDPAVKPGCAGIAAGMGGAWTLSGGPTTLRCPILAHCILVLLAHEHHRLLAQSVAAGYPVLRISQAAGGGIAVAQRPISPDNPASTGSVWWLPLTIGDTDGHVSTASCSASDNGCTVPVPEGLTPPLIVNPTSTGLYRVEYADYAPVLSALRGGRLDPRGAAGLIDDSFALNRAGSPAVAITTALDVLAAALEVTSLHRSDVTCPFEGDGECDSLLWGSADSASSCPLGTDVVDCVGLHYAVWVTALRELRRIRTLLAAPEGVDGGEQLRCTENIDATVRRWIEPALRVLTPDQDSQHDDRDHAAALEEELLLVAGVEVGLPAAVAKACASVTRAREENGFYSADSSLLANEPPTLVPAAIIARVRDLCPGATAESEWESMADAFVGSDDHGKRHDLIYGMADAQSPQLLSATLSFALHSQPAACPTPRTTPRQNTCGSDFSGIFAAVARRQPNVARAFLRENWLEAGSPSRLQAVAMVRRPAKFCMR
jgi:hypothetical protein